MHSIEVFVFRICRFLFNAKLHLAGAEIMPVMINTANYSATIVYVIVIAQYMFARPNEHLLCSLNRLCYHFKVRQKQVIDIGQLLISKVCFCSRCGVKHCWQSVKHFQSINILSIYMHSHGFLLYIRRSGNLFTLPIKFI